jgi:hypothetical protein
VGGFDERLRSSIDHDIWMALAAHGYETQAVDEPLVISYVSRQGRMTADTTPRIQGVRMYLEKWMPTYRDWFGESGADAYAERYFAQVIGRLAADKLAFGRLGEAQRAVRALFSPGRRRRYVLGLLLTYAVLAVARRVLPRSIVRLLKGRGASVRGSQP